MAVAVLVAEHLVVVAAVAVVVAIVVKHLRLKNEFAVEQSVVFDPNVVDPFHLVVEFVIEVDRVVAHQAHPEKLKFIFSFIYK